jgi:predicted RNA-binding Zn-ribbon protein involved in translation (DUF1610 family)
MTAHPEIVPTVTEPTPTTSPPDRSPSRDDPGTTRTSPAPEESSSRDDRRTTRCPVCRRSFTPIGRQVFCSNACRKTAFRRRHQQPGTAVAVPAARRRREFTVYECPDCGDRLLGEQRCESCRTFTRRVGIGGPCPHCDQPVAIEDLLDPAVITMTTT